MKIKFKYFALFLALGVSMLLSGCNNVSSSEVIAENVSTYKFNDMACSELEGEIDYLRSAASSAGAVVDKKKSSATGKNAAAFILFWPALFLIDDNSIEAQKYSSLKGEYEAAMRAHRAKDC